MARRVLQYWDYDDQGSSTYYSPGHIDGGSFDNEMGLGWETGMGGVATEDNQMVAPGGSITFRPTATTFLAKALRATWTTAPSALTIRCGTASEAYNHSYAYVSRLRLECSQGSRLSATVDWMALTPDTITVPTWGGFHSGNPFHWHQGTCTVNGSALNMQSFSVEVNNNLMAHSSLDVKGAGVQRHPEEITAHNETVTMSCSVQVPPGSNYFEGWTDAPADQVASLAFTSVTPTTMTIALANLRLKSAKQTLTRSDGVAVWALEYDGKPNTANTIAIS